MAGVLAKQPIRGVLSEPVTANPILMRQMAGIAANQPTKLGGPQSWAEYGDLVNANLQANFPTNPRDPGFREAVKNMAMNFSPLGIVSPQVAKTLNTARNLPSDDLFRAAVANTPGAEVTDDGLRLALARSQQPEQALQPSVRGGVFYLPEGAAQMKHYSTGRNNYGGSEKIKGETLINNPLFAKGGTGGKAPEAAYDSLLGKGAYQKMRQDALRWSGGPREIREEAVTKFLETYAPEMADQAWYILKNSTKGNQLAYALQEAAVGSAVRKAGHDAVIGHSKGKSGPFISEVFDVREMNYPDKFGTATDIWPNFLK